MKASISQQELSHGLSMVSRAVSPRSTLPVLSNILIATDEGRIRLSATNLELGITAWIKADIQEEGAITVPAKTISDLVNILPADSVQITLNEKNQTLNVRSGASNTDIKGIDAQEFPPMPVPDLEQGIDLNVSDFKDMIRQVAFAAASDDARPVLQGVKLDVEDGLMSMAATDGFRISIRKAELSQPVEKGVSAIVPARALSELARIANDGTKNITMVIQPERGQVLFNLGDAELVSQLIEGNFPDYKAIIPRSFKTSTIISTQALLKACKQAEIIARDSNNVVRVNIIVGDDNPGQIELSAQSEETGYSEIVVDATVDGDGLVIAFNVSFMREVLDVIRTANVALETNANNTPGLVKPVGDEDFTHIIMPMHLG